MPPANFEFLVLSLAMQAQMALGVFEAPGSENARDLNIARHMIDLLGVLQEKTRSNLTLEEQRTLENTLTELRFRYLQAVEDEKQAAQRPGVEESKSEKPDTEEAGANG